MRQSTATSIVHRGPICSMFMGLDNRVLLPPFFPSYRNEDGVLASTLSYCLPNSYTAHLPFSIMHNPQGERHYWNGAWTRIRVSDVLLACLAASSTISVENNSAARCAQLGRGLVALASRPLDEFRHELRQLLAKRASAILNETAQLTTFFDMQPNFWVREVLREGYRLKMSLTSDKYFIPVDLIDCDSHEQAFTLIRTFIFLYGQFLSFWPAIVRCFTSGPLKGMHLSSCNASELAYQ
jgi:hypothetical protein